MRKEKYKAISAHLDWGKQLLMGIFLSGFNCPCPVFSCSAFTLMTETAFALGGKPHVCTSGPLCVRRGSGSY